MKEKGRILGLDLGTKNIGVALSDELGLIAGALTTIQHASMESSLERIRELVEEHGAVAVVVGLPRRTDGRPGAAEQNAREFCDRLSLIVRVPVHMWDEWFTTRQAERALLEADVRRRKRKKVIDKLAAALILQGYLDAHSQAPGANQG